MRSRARPRFCLLLALAVGVQLLQGYRARPVLAGYERSYWLVTYQEGFTRRGLAGELIRLATGSIATTSEIDVSQWLVTLSLVVVVGLLVIVALRRRDLYLDLAAIALCCSPFVFDFIIRQRRPDQVGFIAAALYGLMLYWFPERAVAAAALAGIAFAFAVAVEDSVFLQCVPWIATITVLHAASRGSRATRLVVIACLPGTIIAAASVLFGRLDHHQVSVLQQIAAAKYSWIHAGSDRNVFFYLADDLKASFNHVRDLGIGDLATIPLCVFLFAMQGALMLGFRAPRLRALTRGKAFGGKPLLLSLAGAIAALAGLMVLGIDWARWFASFGLMAPITATCALLYWTRPPRLVAGPRLLAVVVVAAYLLFLAPMGDKFGVGSGVRFLTIVFR